MTDLSAEDAKLVTLARATRARAGAAEGAAVRDADGRTYAAATVDLPSLRLSALGVCVGMAVASGARGWRPRWCSPRPRRVAAADLDGPARPRRRRASSSTSATPGPGRASRTT